jgi:hypothetical protein
VRRRSSLLCFSWCCGERRERSDLLYGLVGFWLFYWLVGFRCMMWPSSWRTTLGERMCSSMHQVVSSA